MERDRLVWFAKSCLSLAINRIKDAKQMNYISTEKAPAAIGPYSQAVNIGDMIYTSGQIPLNANGV